MVIYRVIISESQISNLLAQSRGGNCFITGSEYIIDVWLRLSESICNRYLKLRFWMGFNPPEDFLLILPVLSNTFTGCLKYASALNKYFYFLALKSDHMVLRETLPNSSWSMCLFVANVLEILNVKPCSKQCPLCSMNCGLHPQTSPHPVDSTCLHLTFILLPTTIAPGTEKNALVCPWWMAYLSIASVPPRPASSVSLHRLPQPWRCATSVTSMSFSPLSPVSIISLRLCLQSETIYV